MTTVKCTACHHLDSVHKLKSEKSEDSKLYRNTIRCLAKFDNGDDCDCFVEWYSYTTQLTYGGIK